MKIETIGGVGKGFLLKKNGDSANRREVVKKRIIEVCDIFN